MNDYISILCPTRGRPDRFGEMVESAHEKGDGRFEILGWLDDDDTTAGEYVANNPRNAHLSLGPAGRPISHGWNRMAKVAIGDWFMMGNDDLIFQTEQWDTILLAALKGAWEDRLFVAWADDMTGKAHERCAFPIVSRRWRKTLHYFVPECFNFLWHDTWVWDVGRRAGRLLHIPEVQIEHRHFWNGKAEKDATYKRHREGKQQRLNRAADEKMFKTTAAQRQRDANIIKRRIDGKDLTL